MTETAGQMGKKVEHPNQSQPTPGPPPDESPCTHVTMYHLYGRPMDNVRSAQAVFWYFLVFDNPEKHPRIGAEEKERLVNSLKVSD